MGLTTNPGKASGGIDLNQVLGAPKKGSGAPNPPSISTWDNLFNKSKAQAEIAKYQNDFNYWMWQQENEWNLPKNQMNRFTEAGLNKNLIYGEGTPGNARAGAPAEGYDPVQFGGNPLNMLNQFMDLSMKNAQVKQVEANVDLTRNKAMSEKVMKEVLIKRVGLTEAQASNIWEDYYAKSVNVQSPGLVKGQETSLNIAKAMAQYNKDVAEGRKKQAEAELAEKMLKMFYYSAGSRILGPLGTFLRAFK